jgi:hypothetical protein
VMFGSKWVTQEEGKILEKESRSYKIIRSMGGCLIFGGLVYAGLGVLLLVDGSGKGASWLAPIVLLGIAGIICGVGLRGVKQWAAYASTLVLAAGFVAPPMIIVAVDKASPAVMEPLSKFLAPVLLGLCMCINFFLPTGRKIFRFWRSKGVSL